MDLFNVNHAVLTNWATKYQLPLGEILVILALIQLLIWPHLPIGVNGKSM